MTQNELVEWGLNPNYITPEFLESINCTATLPTRFVEKITKTDGCWIWPQGKKYGVIGRGRAGTGVIGAHVASFILHKGPIKPGHEACHTCDNTHCVNPNHIFQGTRFDNMQDASRKGRVRTIHSDGIKNGDNAPFRTLNSEQVLQIVELLKEGQLTQEKIGRRFGVTQSCIMLIKTGRSWFHLTGIKRPSVALG